MSISSRLARPARARGRLLGSALALSMLALSACSNDAPAEPADAAGSGEPTASSSELAPFDPNAADAVETGLPERIAWANISDAEFFQALSDAIESAATDRGMEFVTANAGGDAQRNVQQMEQFLARGIGALVVQPLDPAAQTAVMQKAIDDGVGVFGLITSPVSSVAVTDQYDVGYTQGLAAAEYIEAELDGEAEVAYFNQDSMSPELQKRHRGVLDGLATAGDGVEVVSDTEPADLTNDAGFASMNTVIQAHPEIDVVLGGDTHVVGAYRALEQSGKLRDEMYLSGIDGDPQAIDLVKEGGAYKASIGFAWPILGYSLGQYAADWIEGKQVPRALVVPPVVLDGASAIEKYEADMTDPASVFGDEELYASYMAPMGNTSFDSRADHWTETYSPE